MDFCQRAHTALEGDEPGRAMMMLVNGLRRRPEREEAVDLLLFVYVYHIHQPGMEGEFLRALEYQDQRSDLLRLAIDKLEEAQKREMASALEEEANHREIEIADPSTPVMAGLSKADEAEVGRADHDSDDRREGTLQPPGEEETEAVQVEGEASKKSERPAESELPDVTPEVVPSTETSEQMVANADGTSADGEATKGIVETQRTKTRTRWRRMSTKRRILLIAGGALAAVIATSITVVGWQHARDVHQIRAVDRAMIAFDPQDPAPVLEAIDDARAPTRGRDDELDERERFVASLIALDRGEVLDKEAWLAEPQTSWGLAASAFMLAQHREWEEAMQFVNYLERAHSDTLAAYFARGRICEMRRQWECAMGRYGRVLYHFEEFVPAHMGAMRVSARRYDIEEWERVRAELVDVEPEHSYLKLAWMDPFELSVVGEVEDLEDVADEDRFVAVMRDAAAVLEALSEEQWVDGASRCNDVEPVEFGVLPVLDVACAKAAAGSVDAEMAQAYFELAMHDEGRERNFFRRLQRIAPQVMVDLGRAERALGFTIPADDDEGDDVESDDEEKWAAIEDERPAHFQGVVGDPGVADAEALLVRARVLNALGATERARRVLEPLTSMLEVRDRAHFERFWSYLSDGDRRRAGAVIDQIESGSLRDGAKAYIAYLEGDYREASRLVDETRLGVDARLVRVKTLALHADGRGRDAIATIAGVDGGLEMLALIPVRERVFARSDARAEGEAPEEDEDISGLNFLLDRGAAKLWRRDLATAERHISAVLKVAPDHPEANWKMGILRRVEGLENEARVHFRRAWRGAEDSTELLIEAGRVQLEAGAYDRAREIFLRATLRERRNVDAVRGLGKAYEGGNRARGRRDLPELLRNYSSSAGDAPARAEMNRWIAIVHDSRRGDEEAFQYLEAAREIGGDRVPVLVEMGRYFEAREEWEDAREHYGTALRINPTVPEIHLAIARVSHAKGDRDAARDHLAQTMRLGPVADTREEAAELKESLDVESGDE